MSKVTYKKLSDITIPPISGKRPSGGVNTKTEGVASLGGENILSSGGVTYDVINRIPPSFFQAMPKGQLRSLDVLINKDGSQTGKVGLYEGEYEEAAINEHLFILRPVTNTVLDPTYLYYAILLPETQRKIERRITGSAQPGLNSSFVKNVDIPYHLITNQKKIKDILKITDQTIEKTEALIHKYQQIKAGLMHDLFTRGLTADGKLRPLREQAPELYQETPIGWIPKEWGLGFVQDHGSIKLGRQRSPNQHSGKWTTPYLRVANVFDGFIDYSDILEMDFTPTEKETFYVKFGDILLNEGQSLELVGRSAIYLGEDDKYCFQNTLVRFRCYKNHDSFFYAFLFKWWLDIGLFMQISKQTTSVAHLGADRFARMSCPVVDYDEQLAIAEKLSTIQKRIDTESDHLLKNRQLKAGFMYDLLTGKVPVTIDKADTAHV